MRKSLTTIGNSLGIVIEKPILDLLNISRDTVLDISTDGRRLILEPITTQAEAQGPRLPPAPAPIGEPVPDFGDPRATVRIVDDLVDRFHMSNELFRRLHHARNYDNTYKAHRDYSAAHGGRFQAGGTNEQTARRMYECLRALEAGEPWEAAIEIAVKQFPR